MNVTASTLALFGPPVCLPPVGRRSIDELRGELRQIQRRLGSGHERPTDMDHARELAHAINNLLQWEYLCSAIRGAA